MRSCYNLYCFVTTFIALKNTKTIFWQNFFFISSLLMAKQNSIVRMYHNLLGIYLNNLFHEGIMLNK